MSVSAADFFLVAEEQAANQHSEIITRSVINRAYYAVYHLSNDFHRSLSKPGCLPGAAGGVHDTLYQQLCNPTIPRSDKMYNRSKQVGIMAKEAKKMRTIADYYLDDFVSTTEADQVVQNAKILKSIVSKID